MILALLRHDQGRVTNVALLLDPKREWVGKILLVVVDAASWFSNGGGRRWLDLRKNF